MGRLIGPVLNDQESCTDNVILARMWNHKYIINIWPSGENVRRNVCVQWIASDCETRGSILPGTAMLFIYSYYSFQAHVI
jgi:hypothetical protein